MHYPPESLGVTAIVTAMTDGERPFLCKALQSVLADQHIHQVILCAEKDNCWLTSTIADCLDDPRLEIVRLSLDLPGRIRNQALPYVKMPWVAYCDGDDVWCANKTSQQVKGYDLNDFDLIGADHYLTNENGDIRAFAMARYIPMPSSWIVRTAVMHQHPFNETLPTGSDGEWWRRTEKTIRKKRCPKLLLKYRVRRNSVSSSTHSKRRKARVIQLAEVPLLGQSIFLLTWCLRGITKQEKYLWHADWPTMEYGQKDLSSVS